MRAKLTQENFVFKAIQVHGNKYDYSCVIYKTTHKKIDIICSIHGLFSQRASSHLQGIGCPKCGSEAVSNANRFSQEEFINKAKVLHQDKYEYSKTLYIGANKKITIICPKHGEFYPQAKNHLLGHECKWCKIDSKKTLTHRVPLRKKIRISSKYQSWRKSIFERDLYMCVKCKSGGKLHADHIKPFSIILDENNIKTLDEALNCIDLWDVNNGRTLCIICHKNTDTYGANCKKAYKLKKLV